MTTKLTIVVGAGASKEVGLPVGSELKDRISRLLDIRFGHHDQASGDYEIRRALELSVREVDPRGSINPHLHAAWRIRDAMPQAISIDNFIDAHQGEEKIELCAKLAIVKSIVSAEKESILYIDQRRDRTGIDFSRTDCSWFNQFVRVLTENCRVAQLPQRLSSVTFVIFNYDRCVEHYLFHALKNYYQLSDEKVAILLNDVAFYHPYGSVGPLPWQNRSDFVAFGADIEANKLLQNALRIKTFTEGTDPSSSEVCAIRQSVATADRLVFLGFSFHRLNMQLLSGAPVEVDELDSKRTYATAMGLSTSDCAEIAQEVRAIRGSPHFEIRSDLKCSSVFSEYSRGISLL